MSLATTLSSLLYRYCCHCRGIPVLFSFAHVDGRKVEVNAVIVLFVDMGRNANATKHGQWGLREGAGQVLLLWHPEHKLVYEKQRRTLPECITHSLRYEHAQITSTQHTVENEKTTPMFAAVCYHTPRKMYSIISMWPRGGYSTCAHRVAAQGVCYTSIHDSDQRQLVALLPSTCKLIKATGRHRKHNIKKHVTATAIKANNEQLRAE